MFRMLVTIVLVLSTLPGCMPTEEVKTNASDPLRIEDAFDGLALDTVLFDTILTEQTSITKRVKIKNTLSSARSISLIELSGGSSSPFQVLLNGKPITRVTDVLLLGGDSLYLFVRVRLQTNQQQAPFLVTDSIRIQLNSQTTQMLYLTAWGRNANYYNGDTLTGTTVWDATKAHFIYKTITVATGATLQIQKGTLIYAAKNAGIRVYGTLKALGDTGVANQIVFAGPRSDDFWASTPAMWKGIRFMPGSTENQLLHARITNAEDAIIIGSTEVGAEAAFLEIGNSELSYHSGAAVLAFGSNVRMWNTVISNTASYYFGAFNGGTYTLIHNTFVEQYSNPITRQQPAVVISNSSNGSSMQYATQVTLRNNVIWGERQKELRLTNASAYSTLEIRNNLYRDSTLLSENFVFNFNRNTAGSLKNYNALLDTLHVTPNFKPLAISILRGKGTLESAYPTDKAGILRGDTIELGAYQYRP